MLVGWRVRSLTRSVAAECLENGWRLRLDRFQWSTYRKWHVGNRRRHVTRWRRAASWRRLRSLTAFLIGVGAQSTLGGHDIFARKKCMKT